MKALREGQGVDVLTVCCRWYGGEMIGVRRFLYLRALIADTVANSLPAHRYHGKHLSH